MKLAHLCNLHRYQRCRRLFAAPLRSHLEIAAARRRPLLLPLRQGGTLRVANPRQARNLFSWVLERANDRQPLEAEDDLLLLRHGAHRLALRPQDTDYFTFSEIFLRDTYGLNALPSSLGDVVDLGGNIGLFAVHIAQRARRVISVEPVEDNLRIARRNLALAGVADKIALRHYALSHRPQAQLRIYRSSGNHGGHSVSAEHSAQWGLNGFEDVPAITLADLFDREKIVRCGLLKCDIEGAEFGLVETAPEGILARIDRIAMEVHLTTSQWQPSQLGALQSKLRRSGFSVTHEPLQDERGRPRQAIMLSATKLRESA